MSRESMPRRASCAAMMVPEKPPPMIATGTGRSNFIIGPVLRIGRGCLAALNMVVDARHRLSGCVREPAGDGRVNERRAAGTQELRSDLHRACAVTRPRHAKRARMLEEEPVDDALPSTVDVRLVRGHRSLPKIWRPRQDSNLWPTD